MVWLVRRTRRSVPQWEGKRRLVVDEDCVQKLWRGRRRAQPRVAVLLKTCNEKGRNAVEVVLAGKSACVVRLAKSDVNWLVSRKLPIEW